MLSDFAVFYCAIALSVRCADVVVCESKCDLAFANTESLSYLTSKSNVSPLQPASCYKNRFICECTRSTASSGDV